MKIESFVTSCVLLRHNQITLDGQIVFEKPNATADDFFNSAYEELQCNYPKFFKMDNLCKNGFLAVEYLLRNKPPDEQILPEERGIVFSNANSSLDTDIRYESGIASGPSPSLFVYTLPNILIGELCIRHRIKGESACFVFDIFDAEFQTDYINTLLETGKIKTCLSGWADYYHGKAEAFFYLVSTIGQKPVMKHDSITLQKIFQAHE